jgi:hypothetical protein
MKDALMAPDKDVGSKGGCGGEAERLATGDATAGTWSPAGSICGVVPILVGFCRTFIPRGVDAALLC